MKKTRMDKRLICIAFPNLSSTRRFLSFFFFLRCACSRACETERLYRFCPWFCITFRPPPSPLEVPAEKRSSGHGRIDPVFGVKS